MLSKRKPSKANVIALRSSQWPGIGIVAKDSPGLRFAVQDLRQGPPSTIQTRFGDGNH